MADTWYEQTWDVASCTPLWDSTIFKYEAGRSW